MRRRAHIAALAACVAALTSAVAASAATPPPAAGPGSLVVALRLSDPVMQAGVVRRGEVVLARGFEVEVARALVRRLGVRLGRFVEMRPSVRLLAGAPPGWQLAFASIEPSDAARAAAYLSTPYVTTDIAVVLRRGLPRPDRIADLRPRVLCAARGTDAARELRVSVRPRQAPLLVSGDERLRTLVRTGACDAALLPAVDAGRFVRGHARELGPVAGRIANGDGLVVAVSRGGGLDAADVDRALRGLRADGTLGRLARAWLGVDPARLRVLR